MRENLKKIGFRLTELSEYLNISRPTLYKYIECYENRDFDQIRPDILLFFSFIESNPYIDKRDAMQYIISHVTNDSEQNSNITELVETMKRFGLSDEKIDFTLSVISGKWMDDLIPELIRYRNIIGRPDLKDDVDFFESTFSEFKNKLKTRDD